MTLADIIEAHERFNLSNMCKCQAGRMAPSYMDAKQWANHLQDAILAAFPALADLLPEANCVECGNWLEKDKLTPTLQGEWLCGACVDEIPQGVS